MNNPKESFIDEITKRKKRVSDYLDIYDKYIDSTVEFNVFWIFNRTAAFMMVPEPSRIIEVYSIIEFKKMIEYFALANTLLEAEDKFKDIIQKAHDNLFVTHIRRIQASSTKEEYETILKELGEDLDPKNFKYTKMHYKKMIEKYAPKYLSLYNDMNFIQHYSLAPSAQANHIKGEIVYHSKKMILKMNDIFIKKYKLSKTDADMCNEHIKEMTKHM